VKPFENFFVVGLCDDPCSRGIGMGAWQLTARYSVLDLNDEAVNGGTGREAIVGLNWYWNPHAKMQLNYLRGELVDRESGGLISGDYESVAALFHIDF
ncbi:MAG: OprO/OprP family phosphate-selective porin, partial [Pirellulaceae bacterium]|nr:OprO/OprP family phosphate-selective porin [Pirellulaceae bacterium]